MVIVSVDRTPLLSSLVTKTLPSPLPWSERRGEEAPAAASPPCVVSGHPGLGGGAPSVTVTSVAVAGAETAARPQYFTYLQLAYMYV